MTQAAGRFAIDAGAELGSGGYGKVYTASDKTTGERVAAKLISVTRMKRTAIEKELKLMEQLGGHEHVIGLRGFEEQPQHVIIYMELAPRGELLQAMAQGEIKWCETSTPNPRTGASN